MLFQFIANFIEYYQTEKSIQVNLNHVLNCRNLQRFLSNNFIECFQVHNGNDFIVRATQENIFEYAE